MDKINITITGDLGSGKSSIAKELCKMLQYKYFSTGNIQREIGKKKGMNTLELNYFSETNGDIDKYIDDLTISINNAGEPYILDSRLAWHFIRKSFKIYLTVNPLIAAKRVISDKQRNSEPVMEDIFAKSLNLIERRTVEDRRFNVIYGVNCGDMNNYDLVIDTTKSTIEEITKLIIQSYNVFLNEKPINKFWVSPLVIYPTEHVSQSEQNEALQAMKSISDTGYHITDFIETVKLGADLFIWEGHKRVSSALFNKISLIPVQILARDDEEIQHRNKVSDFIEASFNLSWLHDWEEFHGFVFDSYPEIRHNI